MGVVKKCLYLHRKKVSIPSIHYRYVQRSAFIALNCGCVGVEGITIRSQNSSNTRIYIQRDSAVCSLRRNFVFKWRIVYRWCPSSQRRRYTYTVRAEQAPAQGLRECVLATIYSVCVCVYANRVSALHLVFLVGGGGVGPDYGDGVNGATRKCKHTRIPPPHPFVSDAYTRRLLRVPRDLTGSINISTPSV